MDMLTPFLVTSAPRALFVILFIVGLAMAVARRERHPNASRLAIIAFVLLIAAEVTQVASQAYMFSHGVRANMDVARTLGYFAVGGLLLNIVGMTLLVLSVFADRNPPLSARTP